MARSRAVLAALAALVLLLAAFAALVSFDASALGRAVLERAAAATGAKLTARRVRLRVLRGLNLEGVQGGAAFTGGRATIACERLVLDHTLWRLALGELAVDRLVIERPHLVLSEARVDAPAARVPPSTAALGRLALRVSRIDVADGTVELRALGEAKPVVMRGFDLRLREVALDPAQPALAGLRGAGEVRAAEVAFPRSRASGLRGALRIAGGRLSTGPVRFTTPQGPFEATVDARLDRLPFTYTLALRGDPLDLASLMAAPPKGGGATAALALDASGVGSEAKGLRGRGTLRLAAGELPSTPLLRAVERALGRTRLVGARYEATEAPFRVEQGRVLLDDVQLRTEQVGLDVTGWASLEGPLDLALAVHTAREGLTVAGVAGGALDLMTDDQGRVVIPLKVTGTQADPRVRPDAAAFAETARRSGARKLLDRAGRSLGGLFRGQERER
ncbi:MAG TPA: AsmA-like C-terminal region-containing protein [Vicinamibacteria bacterium]